MPAPLRTSFIFGKMDKLLDVLIVGGGPIGLACALEAKKAGLAPIDL